MEIGIFLAQRHTFLYRIRHALSILLFSLNRIYIKNINQRIHYQTARFLQKPVIHPLNFQQTFQNAALKDRQQ